jgi:hypothetical protein
MPQDARSRQKFIAGILADPTMFPDEFKSWIPRFLEDNPLMRISAVQLPSVEITKYVGGGNQPAFQGTWVNYGSGNEDAGFYRDPFNRVFLCGLVKSGTAGTTIYTLPSSNRPKARESFAVITGTPGDTLGRVDVLGNGDVVHISGGTAYVQLSGINFRAFA